MSSAVNVLTNSYKALILLSIETLKQQSHENSSHNVNNSSGENKKLDWLVIMDDVSDVAEVWKNFANFLSVSRKFGYNRVFIFHVIVPSSQIWEKIYSASVP